MHTHTHTEQLIEENNKDDSKLQQSGLVKLQTEGINQEFFESKWEKNVFKSEEEQIREKCTKKKNSIYLFLLVLLSYYFFVFDYFIFSSNKQSKN